MACSASSASGGERNLPSCVDSFSITVASKFVNFTSPVSKGEIVASSSGTWTRKSERIIDCPATVKLITGACGHTAVPVVNTITRQTPSTTSEPHLNIVVIGVFLQVAKSSQPL